MIVLNDTFMDRQTISKLLKDVGKQQIVVGNLALTKSIAKGKVLYVVMSDDQHKDEKKDILTTIVGEEVEVHEIAPTGKMTSSTKPAIHSGLTLYSEDSKTSLKALEMCAQARNAEHLLIDSVTDEWGAQSSSITTMMVGSDIYVDFSMVLPPTSSKLPLAEVHESISKEGINAWLMKCEPARRSELTPFEYILNTKTASEGLVKPNVIKSINIKESISAAIISTIVHLIDKILIHFTIIMQIIFNLISKCAGATEESVVIVNTYCSLLR